MEPCDVKGEDNTKSSWIFGRATPTSTPTAEGQWRGGADRPPERYERRAPHGRAFRTGLGICEAVPTSSPSTSSTTRGYPVRLTSTGWSPHLPADFNGRRLLIDTEVKYAGYSPETYAKETLIFYNLVSQRFPEAIYTGEWFLPIVAKWPGNIDYWWAAYPDVLQGHQDLGELQGRLPRRWLRELDSRSSRPGQAVGSSPAAAIPCRVSATTASISPYSPEPWKSASSGSASRLLFPQLKENQLCHGEKIRTCWSSTTARP